MCSEGSAFADILARLVRLCVRDSGGGARYLVDGLFLLRGLTLPELGKQRGVVPPSETVCANDSSQLIGTNSWLLCVGS